MYCHALSIYIILVYVHNFRLFLLLGRGLGLRTALLDGGGVISELRASLVVTTLLP